MDGDLWDLTRLLSGLAGATVMILIVPPATIARGLATLLCGWACSIFCGLALCKLVPSGCDRAAEIAVAFATGLLGWTAAKTLLLALPDALLKRLGLAKPSGT